MSCQNQFARISLHFFKIRVSSESFVFLCSVSHILGHNLGQKIILGEPMAVKFKAQI